MNDKELKNCSSFWKTNNEKSYRRNFQGICTLETGAEAACAGDGPTETPCSVALTTATLLRKPAETFASVDG